MTLSTDVIIGALSLIGVVFAAYLGLRGRRDEVSATQTKTLLEGQDKRIERLESRLDTVERQLREAHVELSDEQSHSWQLRKSLRGGVEFVESVRLWDEGGRIGPLPKFPPVDRWLILLERPRRPPD